MNRTRSFAVIAVALVSAGTFRVVSGQAPAGGPDARTVRVGVEAPRNTEWRTYGADLRSTRYMPLDQVNRDNFNTLAIAWRVKTDLFGPRPEFNFQVTPLVIKGVLYTTAGTRRAVVALDAETGELLWMHRLDEGKRGEAAPRRLSGRGLAHWSGH